MPARAYLRSSGSRARHGPEALTVERPVEARQEQVRALPGPPPRRVGQWLDRLSYKEDAGGSTPPSSTVAEVEADDTPGRGHQPSVRGIWRSAGSHTPCARVRSPPPPPRAGSATGCAAPLQGEGCGF